MLLTKNLKIELNIEVWNCLNICILKDDTSKQLGLAFCLAQLLFSISKELSISTSIAIDLQDMTSTAIKLGLFNR